MNNNQQFEDLDEVGFALSDEELKAVLGGRRPVGILQSKVCDVGGGCWPDSGF